VSDEPRKTFYFWFDCETTGLDPLGDTVLEVAWCFTNEDLELLTPIRQRFTKIMAPPSGRNARFRSIVDPSDDADWAENVGEFVRNMHTDSGLRDAWIKTDAERPYRVLRHPQDLVRLVHEDFELIDLWRAEDRLVLAGAGVSHFDDAVLTEAFGGFYPARPIGKGLWHYRCFDTSVAVMVADARAEIDELTAQLAKPIESGDEILPYHLVACQKGPEQDETDHLVTTSGQWHGDEAFVRANAVPHRAADDVMCSLLDARALRYLVVGR
jgi:oligoribonuclease (3'-5' exoribonuclease)